MTGDSVDTLTRLNAAYIDAVVRADAAQFETILAADFVCSTPEGTLIDRETFLARTRSSSPMTSLTIDDVRIRVLGDAAIVHARTTFALPDGRRGTGRYTDIWARRNGAWLAVSAHVTRLIDPIGEPPVRP